MIHIVGLNYWHAMKCVPIASVDADAADIKIASLERRLLAAETEVLHYFKGLQFI